tara:strand:+ start:18742 stop:19095 length:354 start_codon:yes stop_codon:yes gene_type:complete
MIRPLKTTGRWLLSTLLGFVALTLLAWWLGADPLTPGDWSGTANETIKPWRFLLMLGRWVLWCLLWLRWTWTGECLFSGDTEKAVAQRDQWQSMRHRLLGGIAFVELTILFSHLAGV